MSTSRQQTLGTDGSLRRLTVTFSIKAGEGSAQHFHEIAIVTHVLIQVLEVRVNVVTIPVHAKHM